MALSGLLSGDLISIHAPLRERRCRAICLRTAAVFQSTLPCGSDLSFPRRFRASQHFNPRSLAGATKYGDVDSIPVEISIHAPLRERPLTTMILFVCRDFNPRSLAGATFKAHPCQRLRHISIHAPLRERRR